MHSNGIKTENKEKSHGVKYISTLTFFSHLKNKKNYLRKKFFLEI